MDPNANLVEQLSLAKFILGFPDLVEEDDYHRLAEFVLALDEWITRGGFLPYHWEKAAKARLAPPPSPSGSPSPDESRET